MTENQNPTEELNEVSQAEASTTLSTEEAVADETKVTAITYTTKEQVIERLKTIAESEAEVSRQEIDFLKGSFYRIHRPEVEAARQAFIDAGGNIEEYAPETAPEEVEFKELMAAIREKRAADIQAQEAEKEANYQRKLAIIEAIKEMLATPDEVNKSYQTFKTLQQEWNEIKNIPAEKATDLWKTYQTVVEQFYDTLKLNNEFRAYDFKKNLEIKTAICEAAEKLNEEEDIISAFRSLQQLHQQFRETGPVASELREEIWTRFKNASTIINKKHQNYFEERKAQEQDNLDKKTAICEIIEGFKLEDLKTSAEWNNISKQIIELQAQWKTIGFAPSKMNVRIFERFRGSCDNFFKQKAEFFHNLNESFKANIEAKTKLIEEAEAIKESTNWKEATDKLIELQKQWKETGSVPKSAGDELWAKFRAACDFFFEAKKQATQGEREEQLENKAKKQAIIDRLTAIDPANMEGELRDILRKAQEEWNSIGHVPFFDKEKLYQKFAKQKDRLYGAANDNATRRRVNKFKEDLRDGVSGSADRIREKLIRQMDILKNEIKTYENNLGFLNLSSKSKQANSLVEELNRKVDKLRADLDEVKAKLAAIDHK